MTKNTFQYKGRDIEVVSINKAGGGWGFGVVINGDTINRGGYKPSESEEEAIADGVEFAKGYVDSLP